MSTEKSCDIGFAAIGPATKLSPALIFAPQPRGDDLHVFALLALAIAVRGKRWKVFMQQPCCDRESTFEGQRMATVAGMKRGRALGERIGPGGDWSLDPKAKRLRL